MSNAEKVRRKVKGYQELYARDKKQRWMYLAIGYLQGVYHFGKVNYRTYVLVMLDILEWSKTK